MVKLKVRLFSHWTGVKCLDFLAIGLTLPVRLVNRVGGGTFISGNYSLFMAPITSSSCGALNLKITLLCFLKIYLLIIKSINRPSITSITSPLKVTLFSPLMIFFF